MFHLDDYSFYSIWKEDEIRLYLFRHPEVLHYCVIDDDFNALLRREITNVPIVGNVAAGTPILATENITDYFPVPVEMLPNKATFMLKVKGDSMEPTCAVVWRAKRAYTKLFRFPTSYGGYPARKPLSCFSVLFIVAPIPSMLPSVVSPYKSRHLDHLY